jgi:hypothetical protein
MFRVEPHLRGGIVKLDDEVDTTEPPTPSRDVRGYPEPHEPISSPHYKNIPFVAKRGYTPSPMQAYPLTFGAKQAGRVDRKQAWQATDAQRNAANAKERKYGYRSGSITYDRKELASDSMNLTPKQAESACAHERASVSSLNSTVSTISRQRTGSDRSEGHANVAFADASPPARSDFVAFACDKDEVSRWGFAFASRDCMSCL